MENWLETFLHPFFDQFSGEQRADVMAYIVALLEPAITVGMGIIIAIIVSAVMLPMFDMSQINSH